MIPDSSLDVIGHQQQEQAFITAHQQGSMPHAWLLSGPEGIGKASFAVKVAAWLLSGANVSGGEADMFGESSDAGMSIDASNPVVGKILQLSHPDFHLITSDESKASGDITVDQIRAVLESMTMTSAESPWRVIVVDAADDLNRNAANALLKLLEEPPEGVLLFLISHQPGKLLPTIRSRCRKLSFAGLTDDQVANIITDHHDIYPDSKEVRFATSIAAGSPGVALQSIECKGYELYIELLSVLRQQVDKSFFAVDAYAATIAGKDNLHQWHFFKLLWHHLIGNLVKYASGCSVPHLLDEEKALFDSIAMQYPVDHWVEMWNNSLADMMDAEHLHLDRKLLVSQWLTQLQPKAA